MAEIQSGGETVTGLPLPHEQEALIRAQNARRLARRRQAAALALQVQQTSAEDLSRFGERRQVGGTFESLQAVPERQAAPFEQISMEDLAGFFQQLSFDPETINLGSSQFFTSFGPGVLGLT